MKFTLFCGVTLLLFNCKPTNLSFDKNFYQKTTKIVFPDNYSLVATADNGEFLTVTIIDLEKDDCLNFIHQYDFQTPDQNTSSFIGLSLLDSIYQTLPDKNLLVREIASENGTGWVYYIDTLNCRLFCQIIYPDKDG